MPGVIGTRLSGAGFGGCTISLVRDEAVEPLHAAILAKSAMRTGLTARVYDVRAADGSRRIA